MNEHQWSLIPVLLVVKSVPYHLSNGFTVSCAVIFENKYTTGARKKSANSALLLKNRQRIIFWNWDDNPSTAFSDSLCWIASIFFCSTLKQYVSFICTWLRFTVIKGSENSGYFKNNVSSAFSKRKMFQIFRKFPSTITTNAIEYAVIKFFYNLSV